MEHFALEKKTYVFTATQNEIIDYCENKKILDKEDALKTLQEFRIVPRKNWEKPPLGYKNRDINPWLFRCRLSLLFKPYVQLNHLDDPKYIISPGISSVAIAYILDTYWNAYIEEDRCHSIEMKMWIGRAKLLSIHGVIEKNTLA